MREDTRGLLLKLAGLACLFLMGLLVFPFIGQIELLPERLMLDPVARTIFWELRVPRVLLAACAGAALSVAGAIYQALFRNPLVEPYTLGASSGAALGASLAIVLFPAATILGDSSISLFSLLGALGATLLSAMVGRSRAWDERGTSLLLAGLAVSFAAGSAVMVLQYFADAQETSRLIHWTLGGLELAGYAPLQRATLLWLPGFALAFAFLKELDLLTLGSDLAASRGVAVARVHFFLVLSGALLVAGVVSTCGPLAFVGLLVPHARGKYLPRKHAFFLPGVSFAGALFLMASDAVARVVLAPAELPVGILCALLGGLGFFAITLSRTGKQ